MRKERTRTVTLRIPQKRFESFRRIAQRDDRPLSNFIETYAWRHLQECTYMDGGEEKEITQDKELMASIRRGIADAEKMKGNFIN